MSYTELEHGYQDLRSTSRPIFYVGDISAGQPSLVDPGSSSLYRSSKRGELSDGCDNEDGCMGGSDLEGEGKQVLVGVCAMAKKSQSKPMKEILTRLEEFEYIKILVFPEEVILKEPVEDWPIVDCLISFHSKGFPLDKAIHYANLRNPFIINNLPMQYDIQDRRRVYAILDSEGIEIPRYAVLDRDSADPKHHELVESEDHVEVNGVTFNKPFVEKPVSAEDHNIYIYYPTSAGGGSQRLFRKIGSRSSVYSPESRVRKTGSYIYEDFMPTDGTDVKVYTVGPDYAHAEARKSPALDGKVERDSEGKEIRYPVILSNAEKLISRKVCLAFKQTVCGFDLLRANGKSFVCDVNGFSFVKNSNKYYDDCAKILGNMILRELAPTLHIPWSVPFQLDDPPIVPTTFGKMMELRCVVAVIRHGDRTPKQKMKVEVRHPKFFEIFAKYDGYKHGHVKLKRPKQLQEILDTARSLLTEIQHRAAGPELEEKQGKLEQLKSVLEMYGHFSGINRKVQMKYQPRGRPRGSSSDDGNTHNRLGEPSLVLILKWGGELTPAGRIQAEELGRIFRCMYPGGQGRHLSEDDSEMLPSHGEYAGAQGLGLLRLHSTFRHDLKIYASDEGRVQMTAAAFAKGLLALEGELTPILVQMVKSANTNGLLDNDCDSSKYQNMVKTRLHELLQQDREFTREDREQINPGNALSINDALDFVKNPVKCCQHVQALIQKLMDIVRIKKDDLKTKDAILYHGETWELMGRRWGKIEKDFCTKNKRFDISKIPDIYDCIKYDLQHNNHTLQFDHAEELYIYAKYLADIVIPQEYGLTVQEKLTIGQGICTPLLKKIRADLQRNIEESGEETVNRLNPRYSHGVSSPGRHVRTRLYFTSESHVHSLLTVLRYGGLLDVVKDEQWRRAMEYVSMVSELNYMSQIVVMLYEDPTKDPSSEERFHVELHFSPGVNCCVQKNLPPGPGFRPHSRNESSHNLETTSQCSTRIEEEDTELGVLDDDAISPQQQSDSSPPLIETEEAADSTLDSPTTSRAIDMMDLDPNMMDEPYDSGFLQGSAPIPISARTVAGHEAARLGSQLAASQRQRREREASSICEPRARSYDHQRQDKPDKTCEEVEQENLDSKIVSPVYFTAMKILIPHIVSDEDAADKLQYQSLDAVNKEDDQAQRRRELDDMFYERVDNLVGSHSPRAISHRYSPSCLATPAGLSVYSSSPDLSVSLVEATQPCTRLPVAPKRRTADFSPTRERKIAMAEIALGADREFWDFGETQLLEGSPTDEWLDEPKNFRSVGKEVGSGKESVESKMAPDLGEDRGEEPRGFLRSRNSPEDRKGDLERSSSRNVPAVSKESSPEVVSAIERSEPGAAPDSRTTSSYEHKSLMRRSRTLPEDRMSSPECDLETSSSRNVPGFSGVDSELRSKESSPQVVPPIERSEPRAAPDSRTTSSYEPNSLTRRSRKLPEDQMSSPECDSETSSSRNVPGFSAVDSEPPSKESSPQVVPPIERSEPRAAPDSRTTSSYEPNSLTRRSRKLPEDQMSSPECDLETSSSRNVPGFSGVDSEPPSKESSPQVVPLIERSEPRAAPDSRTTSSYEPNSLTKRSRKLPEDQISSPECDLDTSSSRNAPGFSAVDSGLPSKESSPQVVPLIERSEPRAAPDSRTTSSYEPNSLTRRPRKLPEDQMSSPECDLETSSSRNAPGFSRVDSELPSKESSPQVVPVIERSEPRAAPDSRTTSFYERNSLMTRSPSCLGIPVSLAHSVSSPELPAPAIVTILESSGPLVTLHNKSLASTSVESPSRTVSFDRADDRVASPCRCCCAPPLLDSCKLMPPLALRTSETKRYGRSKSALALPTVDDACGESPPRLQEVVRCPLEAPDFQRSPCQRCRVPTGATGHPPYPKPERSLSLNSESNSGSSTLNPDVRGSWSLVPGSWDESPIRPAIEGSPSPPKIPRSVSQTCPIRSFHPDACTRRASLTVPGSERPQSALDRSRSMSLRSDGETGRPSAYSTSLPSHPHPRHRDQPTCPGSKASEVGNRTEKWVESSSPQPLRRRSSLIVPTTGDEELLGPQDRVFARRFRSLSPSPQTCQCYNCNVSTLIKQSLNLSPAERSNLQAYLDRSALGRSRSMSLHPDRETGYSTSPPSHPHPHHRDDPNFTGNESKLIGRVDAQRRSSLTVPASDLDLDRELFCGDDELLEPQDRVFARRFRSLSPSSQTCQCYNCNVSTLIKQSVNLPPAERSNFQAYFDRSLSHKSINCSRYKLSVASAEASRRASRSASPNSRDSREVLAGRASGHSFGRSLSCLDDLYCPENDNRRNLSAGISVHRICDENSFVASLVSQRRSMRNCKLLERRRSTPHNLGSSSRNSCKIHGSVSSSPPLIRLASGTDPGSAGLLPVDHPAEPGDNTQSGCFDLQELGATGTISGAPDFGVVDLPVGHSNTLDGSEVSTAETPDSQPRSMRNGKFLERSRSTPQNLGSSSRNSCRLQGHPFSGPPLIRLASGTDPGSAGLLSVDHPAEPGCFDLQELGVTGTISGAPDFGVVELPVGHSNPLDRSEVSTAETPDSQPRSMRNGKFLEQSRSTPRNLGSSSRNSCKLQGHPFSGPPLIRLASGTDPGSAGLLSVDHPAEPGCFDLQELGATGTISGAPDFGVVELPVGHSNPLDGSEVSTAETPDSQPRSMRNGKFLERSRSTPHNLGSSSRNSCKLQGHPFSGPPLIRLASGTDPGSAGLLSVDHPAEPGDNTQSGCFDLQESGATGTISGTPDFGVVELPVGHSNPLDGSEVSTAETPDSQPRSMRNGKFLERSRSTPHNLGSSSRNSCKLQGHPFSGPPLIRLASGTDPGSAGLLSVNHPAEPAENTQSGCFDLQELGGTGTISGAPNLGVVDLPVGHSNPLDVSKPSTVETPVMSDHHEGSTTIIQADGKTPQESRRSNAESNPPFWYPNVSSLPVHRNRRDGSSGKCLNQTQQPDLVSIPREKMRSLPSLPRQFSCPEISAESQPRRTPRRFLSRQSSLETTASSPTFKIMKMIKVAISSEISNYSLADKKTGITQQQRTPRSFLSRQSSLDTNASSSTSETKMTKIAIPSEIANHSLPDNKSETTRTRKLGLALLRQLSCPEIPADLARHLLARSLDSGESPTSLHLESSRYCRCTGNIADGTLAAPPENPTSRCSCDCLYCGRSDDEVCEKTVMTHCTQRTRKPNTKSIVYLDASSTTLEYQRYNTPAVTFSSYSSSSSSHPRLQTQRSFSSPDTRPSIIQQPDPTCTARRHRHSISGQMSYFKLLGYNVSKKLTGSANSLFSTAVISGSSSAPNLKDMVPPHASAVAAIEGFGGVPPIRPLETLHNALSLRQLDSFLDMMTSAPLFRTPASSPPKFPSPGGSIHGGSVVPNLSIGGINREYHSSDLEAVRYIAPAPIHYKPGQEAEGNDLRNQLSPVSPNSTGWSSEPQSFLSSEPSSPAPTSAGECSMSMSLVSIDGTQPSAGGPKFATNPCLDIDFNDFCMSIDQDARGESRGSISYTDYYSNEDGLIRKSGGDFGNLRERAGRDEISQDSIVDEDEEHTLTLRQTEEEQKRDVKFIFEQSKESSSSLVKPGSSYKKIGRFRVESMEITDEDVRIKEAAAAAGAVSLSSSNPSLHRVKGTSPSIHDKSRSTASIAGEGVAQDSRKLKGGFSSAQSRAGRRGKTIARSQSVSTPQNVSHKTDVEYSCQASGKNMGSFSTMSCEDLENWKLTAVSPPASSATAPVEIAQDEPILTLASSLKGSVTVGFNVQDSKKD